MTEDERKGLLRHFSNTIGESIRRNMETCEHCRWRSDDFTSACTNYQSPKCADYVLVDDTCDWFEP